MQRIRIILCSVKLRVLNPKLHKQRYIREIKKNDTSQTKHANIIKNVCFFSRASGRFATQKGARFHVVVSSFGFGRLLRRGCPVDDGIFLLSRLFIIIIFIIIIICRRLRAGSREIISFLVFEILSVCRRRAFDDATMRHRTLFGRRF